LPSPPEAGGLNILLFSPVHPRITETTEYAFEIKKAKINEI